MLLLNCRRDLKSNVVNFRRTRVDWTRMTQILPAAKTQICTDFFVTTWKNPRQSVVRRRRIRVIRVL